MPAPDAAAELVQLRQPEGLRALDDHDRGVRARRRPPRSPWWRRGAGCVPATKSAIAASFCAGGIWPWTRPATSAPERERSAVEAVPRRRSARRSRIPRPAGRPSRPAGPRRWRRRRCSTTSPVRPEEISAVSTGWRPGGFSSRTERSMSPYCASVRLRGIGVAVITRMSAAAPLSPRSIRWRTPKRCCSSTTASRRSRKATSFWNSAWVPTRIADLARGERRQLAGALGAVVAAGQDRRAARPRPRPAAGARADAGGRGSRSAPSAPPARRPPPPQASPGTRPASCPSRRRPAAGGSSAARRPCRR